MDQSKFCSLYLQVLITCRRWHVTRDLKANLGIQLYLNKYAEVGDLFDATLHNITNPKFSLRYKNMILANKVNYQQLTWYSIE